MKRLELLIFLFLLPLAGCGANGGRLNQLIFSPDIYISGNFHPYLPGKTDFSSCYSAVTILNGTRYELEIGGGGYWMREKLPLGEQIQIGFRNFYNRSFTVILVARASRNDKVVGTASKPFYFWGGVPTEKLWHIRSWDIKPP